MAGTGLPPRRFRTRRRDLVAPFLSIQTPQADKDGDAHLLHIKGLKSNGNENVRVFIRARVVQNGVIKEVDKASERSRSSSSTFAGTLTTSSRSSTTTAPTLVRNESSKTRPVP
jgi:hypothetical protein